MTLLLAAVVVLAIVVTAGSRLNQSRLGGRNVRTHRRALGRLATITSEQPDRVAADVSQAHLHVRLVDEDARSEGQPDGADGAYETGKADGADKGDVVDLRDPPEPVPALDPTGDPEPRSASESDVESSTAPVAAVRRIPPPPRDGTAPSGLEDRMAALRETEIEVSALPTGAVAALTRLGPTEIRSRRQRRLAGKAARRR